MAAVKGLVKNDTSYNLFCNEPVQLHPSISPILQLIHRSLSVKTIEG